MHYVRYVFNVINCVGYYFWSISVFSFIEQLLNNNFNYKNINSFLSFIAAIVALIFAIFKLVVYWRDSKTKSKILEQELIAKKHANFYTKWDKEFLDPFKEEKK